ncbi:glycosyltransferase [Actinomadura sp. J1-007]|uniref:glycosyltransferase n=1 Tax=Actinomadura sp. J1-007 TaxID=2661913 RepID=UPI001F4F1452|nr:glycosyltransferase [Actinomadura sp. J1-007]
MLPPDEPFALLMTVYGGDREEYVRAAFRSAVADQSLRPAQVVLVQDGPVAPELARCLRELVAASPVEVTFLPLEHNRGLGPALDAGLQASRYDIVARMDADDVAMPHRFQLQVPLVRSGADLVGAGLLEFGADTDDIKGRRIPPSDPYDIARYSRLHDPFNHPTVVYRRSAVLAAGGYGDLPLMEDYWLFVRMIANGARVVNVAEPLVYYRVGDGAYERRGGRALLRSELRLQREMRREGFISRAQYWRNVMVRGGYRLVPTAIRRPFYRGIVAPYGARRNRSRNRADAAANTFADGSAGSLAQIAPAAMAGPGPLTVPNAGPLAAPTLGPGTPPPAGPPRRPRARHPERHRPVRPKARPPEPPPRQDPTQPPLDR